MNNSLKRWINTCSYILNIIFILLILVGIFQNKKTNDTLNSLDKIKECIVEQERSTIPLKVQEYERVHGITIDSMVITGTVMPYSGYLVTTWDLEEKQELSLNQYAARGYQDKFIRKRKVIYVEVNNILTKANGKVSWQDNWDAAYRSGRNNK